ncbi:MAG: YicC family protein, partial [Clostridia bacterium]|nr:YicC family protein [Clostridia bacterium]
MLKSMTAFGRARALSACGAKDITAEIKSVNNRFLDCTVRLPRAYSFLEEKIKAYLSERGIVRGKVEVFIGIDVLKQDGMTITLDEALAESYLNALRTLRDRFALQDDISVMSVAANRDLFLVKKPEDDMERDWEDIRTVLSAAIDAFLAARVREGENLRLDILEKAEKIKSCAAQVKVLSETDIDSYKTKLDTRIRQILDNYSIEIDEQRILTEVAIHADRAAIDEELVRLHSHFDALNEILASDEPAGRRLDFLMQEMNREVNTTGSKCNNAEIAGIVV